MTLKAVNPATEEVIETFEPHNDAFIDAAMERAQARFRSWRLTTFADRAALLRRTAELLEARADDYGLTMTREMGKPLAQAVAEVKKCASVCRHYADHGEAYLGDEHVRTDATQSYVRHLPLGPVLAVMPWNFPFWQVFRFAAPALMAGNVGLLKHASNVPRSALNIEAVLAEAGFPEGCFQTLLIGSGKVERMLRDGRVRAATLTGSGPAGSAVGSLSGETIKPSVLELGGMDAFIVMPSADLEKAVETAVRARTQNNGQSCIAAKRFLVHADIYETFRDRFVVAFDALKLGNPEVEGTDIGPLATQSGRDESRELAERLVTRHGGRVLTRGRTLPERGWYFDPVILELDGTEGADEIFAPAAQLTRVSSLEDAVTLANDSPFGLGSAIFTNEPAEIDIAVRDLEAGSTFVNAMVSSDPRLPFGGVKESGYGRELAADGIRAFVNRKTVLVA